MKPLPVILIFDVGKTNKKVLLFDEQYRLVHEESVQLKEILDEDGFPCDDIVAITEWVKSSFARMLSHDQYYIKAVNFSAYGASFVYLDDDLKPILPLYNYLKPFPQDLQEHFYATYGGKAELTKRTASPVLGSLNSGLQLYRLKYEKPQIFAKIKYALHLPQYLSSILTKTVYAETTSIGCHTLLWDFTNNDYHEWVWKEGIGSKFPPIAKSDECIRLKSGDQNICVGIGLHDSSAALIPYLSNFSEPFILLSTGTWCISLNPFNYSALTQRELESDCLSYLTYQGTPVKASRLFAGYEHEQQVKRLTEYYNLPVEHFTRLDYDPADIEKIKSKTYTSVMDQNNRPLTIPFAEKDLGEFNAYDEAYHELIIDIVTRQLLSTKLVRQGTDVKRIFVDGGFSKNSIYMHLMATVFPDIEVYAASVAQASALGAALAIHEHWNKREFPSGIIELQHYPDGTRDHEPS